MPKAREIFFKEGMVGTIFSIPGGYSGLRQIRTFCKLILRPTSFLSVFGYGCKNFFHRVHLFTFVFHRLYFDKSLYFNRLNRIILTIYKIKRYDLHYFILSISVKTISCCSLLNPAHRFNSFCWDFVSKTALFPLENNWESVISNTAQIFSRDRIVGTAFFVYQEDMVDWGKPERSASWYSVHPRSSQYAVMVVRTVFMVSAPLIVFLVDYTLI